MEFRKSSKAGRAFSLAIPPQFLGKGVPRGSTVAVCVGGPQERLGGVAMATAQS